MQYKIELEARRPSLFSVKPENKPVLIENSHISKKFYIKLSRVQLSLLTLNLMSISLAYLIFDIKYRFNQRTVIIFGNEINFSCLNFLLVLQSVCSCFMLILYTINEKFTWDNQVMRGKNFESLFSNLSSSWKKLLFCFTVELLHPNYLWENINVWNDGNFFTFQETDTGIQVIYRFNDICCAISAVRLYMILQLILYRINFNSDTSYRIW